MRSDSEVENRRREILGAIVRHYVLTGVPVGSKTLTERLPEALSPATIRNVMAELENEGMIEQPHASAGRIPTDKAYRHYVDHLMRKRPLSQKTEQYISEMLPKAGAPAEAMMGAASKVLSKLSGSVGLVLGPALDERVLADLRFVRLSERRILVVAVCRPDAVENRVIEIEEDVSQEELDRAASYLSGEFGGWTLRTIRLEMQSRIEEAREAIGRMLAHIRLLLRSGALGQDDSGPLFVDGTARLLERPDFSDALKIKELLDALDEKTALIKMLSDFTHSPDGGVQISIGKENPRGAMQHCALVVSPLCCGRHVLGALGVVGPTRMEYDRTVPAVGYLAEVFSRLMNAN